MDITKLQTDAAKEESGVPVPFGDAVITLRSRQSEYYKKIVKELFKPHESSIALEVMPEELIKDLMSQATARGLIVTWEGIKEDGVEVPFSPEKAVQYLKIKAFSSFVDANVDKIDNFKSKKEELETKN